MNNIEISSENNGEKQYTIITHDGKFHPDELFAIALLKKFFCKTKEIIRTRDENLLQKGLEDPYTILVDVGLVDDAAKLAFDHHQTSMTKKWIVNEYFETPYSATGLVFEYLVNNGFMNSLDKYGIEFIKNEWVIPIDAADNGVKPCEKMGVVFGFNRNGKEENNIQFQKALNMMEQVLDNIVYRAQQFSESSRITETLVSKAEHYENDNICTLIVNADDKNIDVKYALTINPNIDFFISKREDGLYGIKTAPLTIDNMFSQKNTIPRHFAKLKDDKQDDILNKYARNGNVHFIHKSGFFSVVSGAYEDAIAFAIAIKKHKENN